MTDNIVERLRHRYPQWELSAELRAGHPSVAWEAAEEIEWLQEIREREGNEIERLTAALHGIMEATDLDEVSVIARRALEPKP